MKFKLRDGKLLEDTCPRLKKIVMKVMLAVEKDKGKQFYNGPMTLLFKRLNHLLREPKCNFTMKDDELQYKN